MEIKKYLKVLPVLAALLLTASCSSEDNEIVEAPQPAKTRIVPFTVTVNSGSQTRATLDGSNYYMFEITDVLWVWTDDGKVCGELTWQGGDEKGNTYSGTFSGNLTVEEGGSLENGTTQLNAVIKSASDQIFGTFDAFKARGFVPSYTLSTETPFATSKAEAVQKFSYFKDTSTYWKSGSYFTFDQHQNTTFLSFDITLEDGTAAGSTIPVTISNNGEAISKGSVVTVEEGGAIKAKFIAGVLGDIYLNGATVTLGTRDAIDFGQVNAHLYKNNLYSGTKTYTRYSITATGSIYTVPFTKTKDNIKDQTTLGEILGNKFTSLTAFASSGSSIEFGTFDSENWAATTVTIKEVGETTITVSGTATYDAGFGEMNIPLNNATFTLTVSKMTPPTE